MSFVHGRKTAVLLDGLDLSSYFNSADLSADADVAETSVFRQDWKQNLVGQTSVKVDLAGLYDPLFVTLPSILGAEPGALLDIEMADGTTSRLVRLVSTAYAESSPVGGVVGFKWSVLSDGVVGFARVLHALGVEASGGTATEVDFGAGSAAAGAVAHLQATAASSLHVTIEDASVPSGGGANWAAVTGGVFTSRSTAGAERLLIPGTVRRYVRVTWTGSGTFSASLARI